MKDWDFPVPDVSKRRADISSHSACKVSDVWRIGLVDLDFNLIVEIFPMCFEWFNDFLKIFCLENHKIPDFGISNAVFNQEVFNIFSVDIHLFYCIVTMKQVPCNSIE